MGQHARPESKRVTKTAPTPRLKAGVLRVPRQDGVYVGLDGEGITITGPGAKPVIEMLDGSHSRLEIAIHTGTPRERVDHIINMLCLKGLVDRDHTTINYTPAIAQRMQPEVDAISHRVGVEDGGLSLFLQRHQQVVDIFGLDRVGSGIATLLSASGIGSIRVHDDRKVTASDVAGGVYQLTDVGQDRRTVIERHIRDCAPLEPRRAVGEPDLIILASYPTPEDLLRLGLLGRPYLLAHTNPKFATVGPLVIPSKSACARCIALHRADLDEQWGLIEMARLTEHQRQISPTSIAALATSIATAHALLFLDTGSAPTINATVHCDGATAESVTQQWSKHPLCGCSWDHHHS